MNLEDLNRRMLGAWRLKFANQSRTPFHEIVDYWNAATLAERRKFDDSIVSGPLSSPLPTRQFVPFWPQLADAFQGSTLSFLSVGVYDVMRLDDSSTHSVTIHAVDKLTRKLTSLEGQSYDSTQLLPQNFSVASISTAADLLWNNRFIPMTSTKLPKLLSPLRLTPAQLRHFSSTGNFLAKLMEVWHSRCLRDYTKFWWMDCLHTNLAVSYTKTLCNLCGSEVHYDHFLSACPFLDILHRAWKYVPVVSEALTCHHVYLMHCDRNPRGSAFRTAVRICKRNAIKKDIKVRIMCKLSKLVPLIEW